MLIGTWSTPVDAVSAGGRYTCIRIEGQAWCSGEARIDIPKTGEIVNTNVMTLVQPGARGTTAITQLDTGLDQTCVVAGGAAYCWGTGGGALGNYNPSDPFNMPPSKDPVAVYAGADDDVLFWGYQSPLYQETVVDVFTGEQAGCAVMDTGRAACWGLYTFLTRPVGDVPERVVSSPILVPTTAENPASQLPPGTRIQSLTTEFQNTCAVIATGPMYCWGANTQGQLGPPAAAAVMAPRALPRGASGTGPITFASMGRFHLCFLSGGAAYCSGLRAAGALGDNSQTDFADEPVAVDTAGVLAGVTLTQVVTGDQFSCALSAAGRAYCWGQNSNGQLGNNLTANSLVPVAVDMSQLPAGVTFTQIDAGTTHVCARGSDAKVYCWGSGTSGEQATGTNPTIVFRPQTPMTDTWTG
ncbi:RCC1 domain-containing protein [Cellulomonas sp. Leaf395]|uniref:RCC1 domain-containing protein n=1 Tax=Cellulomonas sp. Leaf395 TaxID=1736362 RepID=UPI0012F9FB76|nr:hypothetical protein [Cellulomonas sp. Leaf395]